MYTSLKDLTIIEGASFIAAPSCALHLAQAGAKVIRFDTIGGGPDFNRMPHGAQGDSLYWQGLNKGKLSIALNLQSPEGRELAQDIITAPGEGRGLFVTNYPEAGFLSHAKLAAKRADLITLRVQGWGTGRNGVDYSVNAAVGVPFMTGSPVVNGDNPVNSTLPAWDLMAGAYGAFALLAAERQRRATGRGQEIRLSLADLAIGSLANLGQVAEVTQGPDRGRFGNALYGAFGKDFITRDGKRLMVLAITARQWAGLVAALGLEPEIARLESALDLSFAQEESLRFYHRDALYPVFDAAFAARDSASLIPRFEDSGVCWEEYRSLHDAVRDDPRLITDNPLFETADHPGGNRYPTPRAMVRAEGLEKAPILTAPRLGQDSEEVLAEHLGLPEDAIAGLIDRGIVAQGK